jgi:hypothetical protein
MPANDKAGQPANDNNPCSTPVRAPRQRTRKIKSPATFATTAPANDNGVNTAVHRDSGSGKQISPPSLRDRADVSCFYILKEVASRLRKSERWLWDWLVWLLQGRRVVALTKDTAIIETATDTVSYRQHNKPALGPLGDSLDDFAPESEAISADNSEVTT